MRNSKRLNEVDAVYDPRPAGGAPMRSWRAVRHNVGIVGHEGAYGHRWYVLSVRRFDQGLFEDRTAAVRTCRRRLNNVIGEGRIRTCNAIEYPIERDLGTCDIAVLAGIDQLFSFAKRRSGNDQDVLIFEHVPAVQ